MFSLMLDVKLKTLHFMSSFTSREQGKAIVEECNKKNLISHASKMLLSFASINWI
jgi:hypothetical protein